MSDQPVPRCSNLSLWRWRCRGCRRCSLCGTAMTPAECMDAVLTANDLILCGICTAPDLRVLDGGLR